MKMFRSLIALAIVPAFLLSLTSCKKDDMEGDLEVAMTDKPADYSALNVEIRGVSAYSDASGWVNLSSENRTVNILSLVNGNEVVLASNGKVGAGTYTKLMVKFGNRFTLDVKGDASLGGNWADGIATFDLGWEGDKDVVIAINKNVSAGASTRLLIDFDAAASVKEFAGTYILRPVITEVKHEANGVRGSVAGAASARILVEGPGGSFSTYTNASGEFLLRGMEKGLYKLTAYPCGKYDDAAPDPDPVTIDNVVVADGEFTYTGVIQF